MIPSQRLFRTIVPFLVLLVFAACAAASDKKVARAHKTDTYFMYVGTYTQEGSTSKGIYAYRFSAGNAQVTPVGLAAETITRPFSLYIPITGFSMRSTRPGITRVRRVEQSARSPSIARQVN